jgi:hypothetical protein
MDGNTASFQPRESPSQPRAELEPQARAEVQAQPQAAVQVPAQPQSQAALRTVTQNDPWTYPAPGLTIADGRVRGLAAFIVVVPVIVIFLISSFL